MCKQKKWMELDKIYIELSSTKPSISQIIHPNWNKSIKGCSPQIDSITEKNINLFFVT